MSATSSEIEDESLSADAPHWAQPVARFKVSDVPTGAVNLNVDGRQKYVTSWPDLQRILSPGGLVVVDNAVSHAQEMESFVQFVQQTDGYITSLAPVGNGELVILKG
jgi:hypothetical protein